MSVEGTFWPLKRINVSNISISISISKRRRTTLVTTLKTERKTIFTTKMRRTPHDNL